MVLETQIEEYGNISGIRWMKRFCYVITSYEQDAYHYCSLSGLYYNRNQCCRGHYFYTDSYFRSKLSVTIGTHITIWKMHNINGCGIWAGVVCTNPIPSHPPNVSKHDTVWITRAFQIGKRSLGNLPGDFQIDRTNSIIMGKIQMYRLNAISSGF